MCLVIRDQARKSQRLADRDSSRRQAFCGLQGVNFTARANRIAQEGRFKVKPHFMGLILLIIIILLLIGAFPTGGYGFGYRSHGLLGTILIIILILWLLGRI
jgi:Protein of unknown function (DUF3309)